MMLKLKKGKASFAPLVGEEELLAFWEAILAEPIYALPLHDLLVTYFRKFIFPEEQSGELKLGFSFWDNNPKEKVARLVSGDGFHYQSPEYPKVLSYGQGIVGRVLGNLNSNLTTDAYVSPDYKKDPYLAASEVIIEDFKFKSGIALPVFLYGNLAGIFKLYCNVKLAPSVKADKARLQLEANRISFLLTLAQENFKAKVRKRFADRFQYVDLTQSLANQEEPMWLLRDTFKSCLKEMLLLVGATKGTIYLKDSVFVGAEIQHEISDERLASCVRLDLADIENPSNGLIGSLEICNKRDGTYFSNLDQNLLTELAQTFSKYLSMYQALSNDSKTYQKQLDNQKHLIEISSKISLALVNASNVDEIIQSLLEGVKSYFSFSDVLFLISEKGKIKPYMSLPPSIARNLNKKEFALNMPSVCALAWKGDKWTINDCTECGKCKSLTTISALRRIPQRIVNIETPPYTYLYADFGIPARNVSILPLIANDTLYGVLDLYRNAATEVDDNEFFFLQSICNVAALAFYNRNLFELLSNIEAEENRGEMARDVVHTLTPTTSALMINLKILENYVDSVSTKSNDKEHIKHELPRIRSQLENLRETIRNQHNLTQRYETMSRRTEGSKSEVDLEKVIEDVVQINSYKASEKRITIRRSLLGKRRPIRAVEMDVYLIMWNLINNAIKFTRGGKPSTIMITERYMNDAVVVSVRDEGVGIKEQDRAHIWDLGFSTPAPGEREATSGVGLATVKDLVRFLEADIQVKSKPNSWTEFTLTIPQKS